MIRCGRLLLAIGLASGAGFLSYEVAASEDFGFFNDYPTNESGEIFSPFLLR
jgi:hypothetical protein